VFAGKSMWEEADVSRRYFAVLLIVLMLVRVQSPNAKSNVCKSAGSKTFVRFEPE
jgi:hypothetical protein